MGTETRAHRSELRQLLALVGIGFFVPVLFGVLTDHLLHGFRWEQPRLYATLQAIESVLALVPIPMFVWSWRERAAPTYQIWIGNALLMDGIVSFVQSLVDVGDLSVFLDAAQMFACGALLLFVWLPPEISERRWVRHSPLITVAMGLALATGVWIFRGHPAPGPEVSRLLAALGSLFLLGGAFRLKHLDQESGSDDNRLFVWLCLAMASVGGLYQVATVWDFEWWLLQIAQITVCLLVRRYLLDLFRRQSRELSRQTEALSRSNRELEGFAYSISHDLQEPLRAVSSYCKLLKDREKSLSEAESREFMGFILDGARRMHVLISDLLEYSRVTHSEAAVTNVDCNAVLEHALLNLQAAIEESGARVEAGPLPLVQGERLRMAQLFQNLIGNAIKYRGKAPPVVHVSAAREGAFWILSFRDNGIGIESCYFERIFGVFQRLHGRDEYEGSGIGLALCKKIVERVGGRIWVESTVGKGSTFHVRLPAAPPVAEKPVLYTRLAFSSRSE